MKLHLLLLATVCGLSSVQAQTFLINDDFTTGTADSLGYYITRSSSGATRVVNNAGSGALTWTTSSGHAGNFGNVMSKQFSIFDFASAPIGSFVQYDISFNLASAPNFGRNIRFGLYDSPDTLSSNVTFGGNADNSGFSDYTGYQIEFATGTGTVTHRGGPDFLNTETINTNLDNLGGGGSPGARNQFTSDTTHSLQNATTYFTRLSITKNASDFTLAWFLGTTGFGTMSSIGSNTVTTLNTSTFDTLGFGSASDTATMMTLNSVQVSIIPEPGSALLALGGLSFLALRRPLRRRDA